MFNLMVFVAGREGLTMEAFLEHYETRHVPLIARIAPGRRATNRRTRP
jgi:hypothetical protein